MDSVEIPLNIYDQIPLGLKDLKPEEVRRVFPHPTLIRLQGKDRKPLFLSILLHANEQSSFFVLQKLQQYLEQDDLARDLIIFVGNVYAAEKNKRFLESQQDYNRIWQKGETPEHQLAQKVLNYAKEQGPLFASIDIHNNTGANPLYGCINKLDNEYVYLASLFAKTMVYFRNPGTVQSVAFAELCPSVTLECGQSGDSLGIESAFQLVVDCLHLESLDHPSQSSDVHIFHTQGQIKIKPNVNYSFSENEAELIFPLEFEKLNFSPLPEGFTFAQYFGRDFPLQVFNDSGEDIAHKFFIKRGDRIEIKKEAFASMFTRNREVIAQDCLGYLMEEIQLP